MTVSVLPAILTSFCFASGAVSARQSSALNGPLRANLLRLLIAFILLGIIALSSWRTLPDQIVILFVFAGGIGFGLGGYCMMHALQRLGSPRALLTMESVTAMLAGLLSWVFLDDPLSAQQILSCLVIIVGILVAGSRWLRETPSPRSSLSGYGFATAAAFFQAISMVLSRAAFLVATQLEVHVGMFNAAFLRLAGGLLLVGLMLAMGRVCYHFKEPATVPPWSSLLKKGPLLHHPLFWAGLNALFGPVLGITCWLWAVSLMNPGIVQSVAATAPLISIPVSRRLEFHELGKAFYVGSLIAISGIALLCLW